MKYRILTSHLLAFLILAPGCKQQDSRNGRQTVHVKIATANRENITLPIHSTGQLVAASEVLLSFKTGGIIGKINVREGEEVYKGQEIATLDIQEVKAAVDQARLMVQKSERDFQRAENLYKDSVATLETLQNAKTALDIARAQLSAARFNLEYSVIKAPVKGKILKVIKKENEMVGSGHPVIMFASTESNWQVKTSLIDMDVVRVTAGDSALVRFDPYPGIYFKGEIAEMSNAPDPYTGTYDVKINLSNQPEKLISGLIGEINIFPRQNTARLVIPVNAMLEGTKNKVSVFLIQQGKPVRKEIVTETIRDNFLLVKEGIREGDTVVTEGAEYIKKDFNIEIVE